MGYFTIPEIEYFHEVKDQIYRRNIPNDIMVGETLSGGVWEKTKRWANSVQINTTAFTVSCKKAWQKSGWEDGRVAQIKPYTWARIFKPEDAEKGIYFTIGVDAGRQSILIKIHYQERAREQAKALLTPEQIQICERLIKTADRFFAYCKEIHLQQVDDYSLERLTNETIAFLEQYESAYDLIIQMVWPTLTLLNETVPQTTSINFEPGSGPKSVATTGTIYTRSEKVIQPALIHQQISLSLYEYLVEKYGSHSIRRECPTSNNTVIDMVRQEDGELIIYEIKTYPSVRTSIREAVGQLLEYSYWSTGQLAKELIIVTPLSADAETRSYMSNLRATLNIPIWYQQFDLSRNALGSKV